MARDLEPPADDEGFAEIRIEPFVREHRAQDDARPGLLLPLEALEALNGARVADVMTSAPPRAPPRRSGCRSSRSASAGQPG